MANDRRPEEMKPMMMYEQGRTASGGRVDVRPAGRRVEAIVTADVEMSRFPSPWEPPTTTDQWNVALHRPDIDWAGGGDQDGDGGLGPRAEVGDLVRVVMGEHLVTQARDLGGPQNRIEPGMLCPAVVVRRWSDECLNLKILLDGARDLWATSVYHYPVLLQHPDPEDERHSLLHARGDTWHPLDEPFGLLENPEVLTGPTPSDVIDCPDCDAWSMTPVYDGTGVFLEYWMCTSCGRSVMDGA